MSKLITLPNRDRFLEGGKLLELVAKIGNYSKQIPVEIHTACISAAMHIARHGSDGISVINDLNANAKAITHANGVAVWLNKFAPVVWDKKEKKFKASAIKITKANEDIDSYVEMLLTCPTYSDLTKANEDPFKKFDVLMLLKGVLKKHENVEDANDTRHNFVGLDLVRDAVARIEAGMVGAKFNSNRNPDVVDGEVIVN